MSLFNVFSSPYLFIFGDDRVMCHMRVDVISGDDDVNT